MQIPNTPIQSSLIKKPNSTLIRGGGRIVGQVDGDIFIKSVQGSRHFLRIPPAICFDIQSIIEAVNLGASKLRVIDVESGIVYQTNIEDFRLFSFPLQRGGFERQRGLRMSRWTAIYQSESSSREMNHSDTQPVQF